ncbi:MAG TPA: FGGY family carbohydrate kinase [Nordella sp.]|nr:FGGY family carbohydrate kinase [Nordella sp.]
MTLALGIDLGTSAVKCVALAADGEVVASGQSSFPTIRNEPGQAEQEPAAWLAAAEAAVRQAVAGRSDKITTIGLTGQLPTLVCLAGDEVQGRAITWMDARADDWAAGRLDEALRQRTYQLTGMPIDGRYLAPMLMHHRALYPQIDTILSAKDYLCFALTKARVTDPSTAAGYGVYDFTRGQWDDGLCRQWDLAMSLLPAIAPAASVAVPLSRDAARRLGLRPGIPVHAGAADSAASAYAMTGLEAGTVSVTTGSSTVIMDASLNAHLDTKRRYLLTPHARERVFGREMDLLSTGSSYRWLSDLLGWPDGEIDRRAAASVPGAKGLFFAPYLAGGEQGALWNPDLRGVLHGLTIQHRADDIARAYVEGVQFEIRRCIDILAETQAVTRVIVAGHATDHPDTLQLLADIVGRPVTPYAHVSPAAIGAALLAMPDTPVHRQDGVTIAPSAASSAYDHIYHRYCALFPRIAGITA